MPVLANPKHEQFAQHYARFGNATQAYVKAGYSDQGAAQSAARLLKDAKVCARVEELKGEYAQATLELQIADRNQRVLGLQDKMSRIEKLIDARSKDKQMAEVAGGDTGLLVAEEKIIGFGENATLTTLVRFDAAVIKEYRETIKQAAQELGQWSEGKQTVDHTGEITHKHVDATAVSVAEVFLPHEIEAALAKLLPAPTENA